MNIVEVQDDDLQSRLGKSGSDRSTDRLHLSDIYKVLAIRMFPERFDTGRPMDLNRVEVGLLFENMLERALAEKFATERPGEIVSDEGVVMSPDGINPDEIAGEEYKATFMSSGKGICETVIVNGQSSDVFLDKFIHWSWQILGYAKWLDVRTFMLRVLFVNGDYKYNKSINPRTGLTESTPTGPQFKSYRLTFTDKEVDDNWDMLMEVAREEGLL